MREPFPGQPPPLTNRPEGLLSLLGIQNAGRYPQHFANEFVRPTLDLLRWYMEAEQDYPTLTQNVTAAGFTMFQTVPVDEQWLLLGGSCETAAALGNARKNIQLVKANTTGSQGSYIPLSDHRDWAFGERVLFGCKDWGIGMLLRPLTQLGLWQGTATAADSFSVVFRVVRLNVA